jgi:F-box protein, helicase, 18
MFSSARDELARQTDVERKEPIVIDADSDDTEARKRARADARIERERVAELKRKQAQQKPKQSTLVDAYRRGMQASAGTSSSSTSDALPRELLQRVLTYAPVKFYADARLVSKAWRDAVDDEAFMPFVKLNRALALGGPESAAAQEWFENETGGRVKRTGNSSIGVGGLLRFVARSKPFKSRLDVSALVKCIREDAVLNVQTMDKSTQAFVITIGDVAATIESVAEMKIVNGCGWAALAFAMVHVAENEIVGSRLLRAARLALRASDGADFVEEDLVEFSHLITGYVRSLGQLTTAVFQPGDQFLLAALRQLKARMTAAVDYADIEDERDLAGMQPGMMDMPGTVAMHTRLTREQDAIVSTNLQAPHYMVVRAFAGSGKTTTLIEYARRNPSKKFLYLAFNKAITLEAKERFPPNTDCKTFHGLAYPLALWYQKQGKKLAFGDRLRADEIARALKMPAQSPIVGRGLVTLQNYLVSDDDDISSKHVPPSRASSEEILNVARSLWTMMKDVSSNEVPLTHAGYMKLYSLQRSRLDLDMSKSKTRTGYDIILLDEAQDIAPVMFDIIYRQDKCAKVLVGDSHQQIYNFTGATNVLDGISKRVPPQFITHRRLVRSFRFGPSIANIANAALRLKEEPALLIGARALDIETHAVYTSRSNENLFQHLRVGEKRREQLTILVRSNASLIAAMAKLVMSKDIKLSVVGGIEALKLEQIVDFVRLMNGETSAIQDKYIRRFIPHGSGGAHSDPHSLNDNQGNALTRIALIAENQDDFDMLTRIRIAETYGQNIFEIVAQIRAADVGAKSEHMADFVLSTAHKSKGLEWDSVLIWNDFINIDCAVKYGDNYVLREEGPYGDATVKDIDVDEINLLYVAVTRARKRVFLNTALARLAMEGDYDLAPFVVRHLDASDTTERWCHFCEASDFTSAELLWRADSTSKNGLVGVRIPCMHLHFTNTRDVTCDSGLLATLSLSRRTTFAEHVCRKCRDGADAFQPLPLAHTLADEASCAETK